MTKTIIASDRQFQIWKYTVGHCQLLLRSTKSAEFLTRIDVFFKGVKEFHLPTHLKGLSLSEASDAEIRHLCSLRKSVVTGNDVKVFKVQGTDYLGYVTALMAVSHEDEGEYDDPSYFATNNII